MWDMLEVFIKLTGTEGRREKNHTREQTIAFLDDSVQSYGLN